MLFADNRSSVSVSIVMALTSILLSYLFLRTKSKLAPHSRRGAPEDEHDIHT